MSAKTMEKQPPSSNKWAFTAGLVILGALFLTRGGLASVAPLLRYVLPAALVALTYRYVKTRISARIAAAMRRQGASIPRPGGPGTPPSTGPNIVIDLCPKCGSYLQSGHRCAKQ